MSQGNSEGLTLVKLDDFEGELEEHWQDIQGHSVLDKNGDEVGTVEDLYIYEDAQAVHLIKVAGSEHHFLIPVDAVTTVGDEGVNVEQDKELILGSPEYDSEEVPDLETSRAAYAHYGYPDQLTWSQE
ncbi:MAG TPA: PRC-barrel domain-containing protein [Rubrobacteraceae bacterium]|jgi:sporulation protein YlmC with PRC-barrel domain|nr:PRC-barrel domain-containing protein [Rubrobacteraceae bacterium]